MFGNLHQNKGLLDLRTRIRRYWFYGPPQTGVGWDVDSNAVMSSYGKFN